MSRDAEELVSAAATLGELAPRLGRLLAACLKRDPEIELSLRQYRMLEQLSERPLRTTELAFTSDVSQPTASVAVGSLEARGLVTRHPDPQDRRATLLELTPAGLSMLAKAKSVLLAALDVVTEELSDEHALALREMQPVLLSGIERARVGRQHLQDGAS